MRRKRRKQVRLKERKDEKKRDNMHVQKRTGKYNM
jgi:hypothetical protein